MKRRALLKGIAAVLAFQVTGFGWKPAPAPLERYRSLKEDRTMTGFGSGFSDFAIGDVLEITDGAKGPFKAVVVESEYSRLHFRRIDEA